MPWSSDDYPTSWKNLDDEVRDKAIEIGNALVADGMDDGRAIPIALSQARKALERRREDGGPDLWVTPHEQGWAVRAEGVEQATKVHGTKEAAVDHAVQLAKQHDAVVTVQRADGTVQERQTFRSRL